MPLHPRSISTPDLEGDTNQKGERAHSHGRESERHSAAGSAVVALRRSCAVIGRGAAIAVGRGSGSADRVAFARLGDTLSVISAGSCM